MKEKETKFKKICKCGKRFDFTIGSPTGTWWFTCGRCGKYYWQGMRGFLGGIKHRLLGIVRVA